MRHRSLSGNCAANGDGKSSKKIGVDDLLARKSKECQELEPQSLNGFMTLTFLGYYEKKGKY